MSDQPALRSLFDDNRFRLLVDAVIDYAIYMIDPQGTIVSWNTGARRFKGYQEAEILGANFSCFYTPEDRQAGLPERALNTAIVEGRFEGEGWRVRKDGTRFWCHVVIDPIRDPGGNLLGFAKITRDISDTAEAQKDLKLAREALFQSQKLQAVGQLSGGVAHDFNNLLTVIQGNLELLRKRVDGDPKLSRLVDNALLGTARGVSLTQRMLAFARRQELKIEAVQLPRLVENLFDLLCSSVGDQVTVRTELTEGLPAVHVDINQLELALLNLVSNARDAMPAGGTLSIKAEVRDKIATLAHDQYVCLSVVDNGEGMDEQTLAYATDPFFTTKGVGKGTGLGLSMVHGLAEQMGGRLVLKSSKGQGTTAELWLPVETGAAPRLPLPTEDKHRPLFKPMTVLVVDDDSLVLNSTMLLLEDLGHQVICAASGLQALQCFGQYPGIDLMITDVAMPQMNGAELAEAVRKRYPGLPIILATGYAQHLDGLAARLPRILKPYSQLQLMEALAQVQVMSGDSSLGA